MRIAASGEKSCNATEQSLMLAPISLNQKLSCGDDLKTDLIITFMWSIFYAKTVL